MQIKSFALNPFQVNAYIVFDESNEAVLIDAACINKNEEDILCTLVEKNNLIPVAIFSTHGHVDHICGNAFLKEKYAIPFYMNRADNFFIETALLHGSLFGLRIKKPPLPDANPVQGDVFRFGNNSELHVLEVPGHSPGSIAIFSPKANFVITGDALFAGSIGRTDLPKGNYSELISSVNEKLFTLPSNTQVLPGHGDFSTIEIEKAENPFF